MVLTLAALDFVTAREDVVFLAPAYLATHPAGSASGGPRRAGDRSGDRAQCVDDQSGAAPQPRFGQRLVPAVYGAAHGGETSGASWAGLADPGLEAARFCRRVVDQTLEPEQIAHALRLQSRANPTVTSPRKRSTRRSTARSWAG